MRRAGAINRTATLSRASKYSLEVREQDGGSKYSLVGTKISRTATKKRTVIKNGASGYSLVVTKTGRRQ